MDNQVKYYKSKRDSAIYYVFKMNNSKDKKKFMNLTDAKTYAKNSAKNSKSSYFITVEKYLGYYEK